MLVSFLDTNMILLHNKNKSTVVNVFIWMIVCQMIWMHCVKLVKKRRRKIKVDYRETKKICLKHKRH